MTQAAAGGSSEQLGLEGMPRRLFMAAPTRLNTWVDCPRRYRMTYLDRPPPPKGPPWAHNSLGAAVHTALKRWYDLPVDRRTPAAAGDLLEESWLDEGFRDDAHSAEWRARARTMVEDYVAGVDPHDEPVGVERTVALRTDVLALSGRVDRIDERVLGDEDSGGGPGTELVVVDYKTGRRAPDVDDCRGSLALAVYAAGAARTLRTPCRTVELHHLPTGQVTSWTHSQDSLERHLRRADSIGAEAAAAETVWREGVGERPEEWDRVFPPRPGSLCSWCDYVSRCPEGRAVAPTREPWSALDEEWGAR